MDVAARLVPMLTGVGQPDFEIDDMMMSWKGTGGELATGFFGGTRKRLKAFVL